MSSSSSSALSNPTAPMIVVYVIPGSQFSAKVLAALDLAEIPHCVEFAPYDLDKRRSVLPSGGTLVPEIKVLGKKEGDGGDGDDVVVVSDSERILHWLDDHRGTHFFPSEQASELSVRASQKTLAGLVWYYNYVDPAGYARSMRRSIQKLALPSWMMSFSLITNAVTDWSMRSTRAKHRTLCREAMGMAEMDDHVLDDEPRMRQMLLEELRFFQSFLNQPTSEQPYLLPGSAGPTAADLSVYVQLERLMGAAGSDLDVPGSLPDLRSSDDGLQRLWEWHDHMRTHCPVRFKGKRRRVC